MRPASLVVLVCSAQVLVQIGAFVWPALLPEMSSRWQLSNTEAGWVTASFYGAYADVLRRWAGWEAAFIVLAITAAVALLMVALLVPPARRSVSTPGARRLLDFRPVLRNRSAIAYSLAYGVHTLEMSALRGWTVAFLAFVAGTSGSSGLALSPVMVATTLGLVGTVASVAGNEAAIRLGRTRLITLAMAALVLLGLLAGSVGSISYALAVGLLLAYSVAIWLDSSSLTAGATGSAAPALRGATLAVHSMLGYAGGFVGPILVGWVLDAHGAMSHAAWGAAFATVASIGLASLVLFRWMRPDGLPGDRGP